MNKFSVLFFFFVFTASAQTPLGSEFTYQGNLQLNGVPADGIYDLDLYLFDADIGGSQTGQLLVEDVPVDMGFFSINIDFGDAPFSGDEVWMEIRIRDGASVGGFQQLLPRQKITATPYATQSQFVADDAVGNAQIQDGAVSESKLDNDAVNTNNLIDTAVTGDKLADDAVTSGKILDGEVDTSDLADGAVNGNKLANDSINGTHIINGTINTIDMADDAVTQSKLASQSVGMNEIITTEVQRRAIGNCAPGQYVTTINEDGTLTCANAVIPDRSAEAICQTSAGTHGILIDGVCVLGYSNSSANTWTTAVSQCASLGGDLCSASQYLGMRSNGATFNTELFYSGRAVWSNAFSDNDGGTKTFVLRSADNPSIAQQYAYACCGNVLPEPSRSRAQNINGVLVTYIHPNEDTIWTRASQICSNLNSDLCTKAQYVALNDAGHFNASVRRATNELSDNDNNRFDPIVGINTSDNPSFADQYAYACCAQSTKPIDLSCPGTLISGICVGTIHEDEDTLFADAARACHAEGTSLCSKSQMQVIRNAGQFDNNNACWTADGADNDSGSVGGLLSTQADDPDPTADLFGYACCY